MRLQQGVMRICHQSHQNLLYLALVARYRRQRRARVKFHNSSGHTFGVVIRVRNSIPKLYGLGVSRRELKSAAQRGSAVKAAFTLERFCPNNSVAPVLAIV